jgi:siderophore synthetase component
LVPGAAGRLELAVDPGRGLWDVASRGGVRLDGRAIAEPELLLDVLALDLDPEDGPGMEALRLEAADALESAAFAERARGGTERRLEERHGPLRGWTGLAGAVALDALAAFEPHPVYPLWQSRGGMTPDEQARWAPEAARPFLLRWCAVRADHVTGRLADQAHRPAWWPTPDDVGLQALAGPWALLPVHPMSEHTLVGQALRAKGIDALMAPLGAVEVVPTLSMRTVALTARPGVHVKVPLPLATLGARNRRTIAPGTLVDGAAGQALLTAIQRREPILAERILLADETCWAHAGHEGLAALVRQYPDLDDAVVVPLAALGARLGRAGVAQTLADRFFDGDVWVLFGAVARAQLESALILLTHGVALEAHQQNVALVLDAPAGGTRVRLLLKDNDGLRVQHDRIGGLGADAVVVERFADERIVVDRLEECLDVFTTITVNLCVVAVAQRLAALDGIGERVWRQACARALVDALGVVAARDGEVHGLVRDRVLLSERWPVKAMVTAGTLRPKTRTGASDINKRYTTGPNPLRAGLQR